MLVRLGRPPLPLALFESPARLAANAARPRAVAPAFARRAAASSGAAGRRAPHKVLGVPVGAPPATVKARFRHLAKLHHPDTQPQQEDTQNRAAARMAELVEAYDALMDDDLAGRLQGNVVASSCEAFTVEELVASGLYDVFALRLLLDSSLLDAGMPTAMPPAAAVEPHHSRPGQGNGIHPAAATEPSCAGLDQGQAPPRHLSFPAGPRVGDAIPIVTSLDDSVLDLKRALQQAHGGAWGLTGRSSDRHGLAFGWELVFHGSALSYHLFLLDYGVRHADIMHAVVRRDGA